MKAPRLLWGRARALWQGLSVWLAQRWLGRDAALRQAVFVWPAGPKRASAIAITRDLNEVVHQILVAGLLLSAILMLVGLVIDLGVQGTLPPTVLPPAEAIRRAVSLRPSGFLSLGLLTLILTPLLRVVGSLIVFAWERDGRYVVITALVLIVMLASLWVGQR